VSTPATAKRSAAGFFSTARTFFLPIGERIEPERVRGYPIDMRAKARTADWQNAELQLEQLHINAIQYGLGCHERWLAGEGDQWLDAAVSVGGYLVSQQDSSGAWWHRRRLMHTYDLRPPWASGLAQGEGASLLVRLALQTGRSEFAAAARLALLPLYTPVAERGVGGNLDGSPWPEEYPTTPQSHVLNGAIFALWGLRDVAVGLGDERAAAEFGGGVDSLAANLHRYDTGYWSLYSLFPHPVPNVASSFYHALHVTQLEAMNRVAPRPEFERTRERWQGYSESPRCRRTAFASKAVFRLLVPRNRLLAHRLPWNRLRGKISAP
jgi:heparosan-N-sulfate-glucuronate 5-epimerase